MTRRAHPYRPLLVSVLAAAVLLAGLLWIGVL